MDDLILFLEAENNADEQAAKAAVMTLPGEDPEVWVELDSAGGTFYIMSSSGDLVARGLPESEARHIARHDPARVLRECAARRRLITRWESLAGLTNSEDDGFSRGQLFEVCQDLKDSVQSYAGRPGFKEEWDVTQ